MHTATPTVENYVKQLFMEQQRTTERLVPLGKLAAAMRVVPGTATTMVKALADSGLVHYEPRNGARLTRSGEKLALHVLRRHRLVELFLVKVLGLDWSEVHEEAEVLEHAISEKVLQRIDQMLGHPTADPHGDLIPDAAGEFTTRPIQTLIECEVGQRVRVAAVESRDKEFLKFAEEHGLVPGNHVRIEEVNPIADAISIQPEGRASVVIGMSAAGRIQVEVPREENG